MTTSNLPSSHHWFKGSRDRGYRGDLHSEINIPELLRLKKVQQLWDIDEDLETISNK